MASGVNSTFRQIGLAMSIAALGTIFISGLQHQLGRALAAVPPLQSHTHQIVAALRQGQGGRALGSVPANLRQPLEHAITSSFSGSLNNLLVVSGSLALVGAVASFLLIRSKDFVQRGPQPQVQAGRERSGVGGLSSKPAQVLEGERWLGQRPHRQAEQQQRVVVRGRPVEVNDLAGQASVDDHPFAGAAHGDGDGLHGRPTVRRPVAGDVVVEMAAP